MADQLNMGGLNLGPSGDQQGSGARSYIPPHMRGKMGGAPNGNPNMGMNGPPGPGGPAVNGLNNSAWAG